MVVGEWLSVVSGCDAFHQLSKDMTGFGAEAEKEEEDFVGRPATTLVGVSVVGVAAERLLVELESMELALT